ncbi:ABC transporter ATP-binding protein [Aurantibacillus circumpalustris]|uniref:ABC transporter ATP-binding protein n=1 Tax=Aurantibacillus circumpalustris TaxID=3036359 RepID=UPI00295A9C12|nr:ABC transporter ATP-binding protein [Aurantibacillus circumpalustris]
MIEVRDLIYTYAGAEQPAIKKVSFDIPKGEVFGFLGPSGAGKSTVQKILFKLLSNYVGRCLIDGKEVKDWDKSLYEKIGVGFELPNHYLKLSALENLNFFRGFYSSSTDPMELLEMVGLEQDANKKVGDFSKGMKMRLNFIRSFIHNPDILFLDEPTSGLDPVNARIIKDIVLKLKKEGKTIFITTHQMHDADELCDRVAFLVDGKILAIDEPKTLKLKHSNRKVEVSLKNRADKLEFSLDNLGNNAEFINAIKLNIIDTIHSKEASLDDIFIKVTGKSLT